MVYRPVADIKLCATAFAERQPVQIQWVPPHDEGDTRSLIVLSCNNTDWPITEAFDAVEVPRIDGGSLELPPLPDLRCPYVVRYVREVRPGVGEIIAEVELVHGGGGFGARPQSLHVGFTAARDEMLVTWVSGKDARAPQVQWGVSHKVYTHVASGSSSTYGAKDLCNAPANQTAPLKFINPGMIHRVTLRGLPPFTKIYYRVRHDEQPWGEEHVFRSRRPAAASSVRFLMYADQALPVPLVPHVAWRLVPQVVSDIEGGYDSFLLHPGDLGYAMGSGYIWDVWGALIEPISSRIPYMVTVGNHEYDHTGSRLDPSGAPSEGWHPPWGNFGDDSRGECGVPTAARFSGTGSSVAGANGVFWYSFDEGPVHVTMLSSEHEWTVGSRQYEWLAADLAAVDRAATPWIVLATHRMMYTTQLLEEADYNVSLAFRREVEPLLTRHKVNLMLVGHQHSYERSCAAFDGACVPPGEQGTVHLVVGSAGASLERGGFSPALGHFSLKHVNDWGYLRLDANASRLRLEWVRTDAHDGAGPGQVWDSVELLPWM